MWTTQSGIIAGFSLELAEAISGPGGRIGELGAMEASVADARMENGGRLWGHV